MRTLTWTVAITSPTACRTRWTGCDSARAGSGSPAGGGYPSAVNLRPAADWPDRAVVAVDLARVAAVIDRIAADVDELARARRAQDLDTAAVLPDPRAQRRRRLAEPDLEFRAFCTRRRLPASSTPQLERAWDAWQAEDPAGCAARTATIRRSAPTSSALARTAPSWQRPAALADCAAGPQAPPWLRWPRA